RHHRNREKDGKRTPQTHHDRPPDRALRVTHNRRPSLGKEAPLLAGCRARTRLRISPMSNANLPPGPPPGAPPSPPSPPQSGGQKVPISIQEEMRTSYLDYAMSVIVGRAIPD